MQLIRANRDLRVDFFRGLALWWIFTDHVPGDVLGDISLRNFALCDATEVFVLLAGYGAGLAYGGAMDRSGWLFAAADVIRRAWTLYVAHIFLFVVFSAQVAYSATALDRTGYLDEIHLDVLADAPYRALLEALILRFQPAYLNILPLYVVLLGMLALALPLLRRPAVLAMLSFALYAAARLFGVNLPSWTGGGWFFNPLTWQLLFFMGAILAYAPGEAAVPTRRARAALDAASIAVVLLGLVIVYLVWGHQEVATALPGFVARLVLSIDKTGMHPFRLLSILALTWLATRLIPPGAPWLRSRAAAPFALMGQNSLPVFCSGIFISFLGRLAMEDDEGWPMQIAVNVIGFASLVAVGALAAWYREKGRASAPPRAPSRDTRPLADRVAG
jgi:hypothetical protein